MKDFFYKYKDTRFHNLHPAYKFLVFLAIILISLIAEDLIILGILYLATLLIVLEAKIFSGWKFYMQIGLWISATIVLLNLLLNQGGDTILFYAELNIPFFETIRITIESLQFGMVMALRMLVVISSFAVFSLTVSFEEMMDVLSKLRIPQKSVFLTSLSTRFVPSLLADIETLTQVQRARGARLKGLRGKGPILIPLLSNSLERSVSVAEAMEARGINSNYDQNQKP